MIKFYSNENFPLEMVKTLRKLGYNVLTSYESGRANQKISDDQVLAFAKSEQRIVITLIRNRVSSPIFLLKEKRSQKPGFSVHL